MTYLLITQVWDRQFDHELFSEKPTFSLKEGIHTLLEGNIDGGDMRQLFPAPRCHYDDCLLEATITHTVDLDAGNPEVGPQPHIVDLLACSLEHMRNLFSYEGMTIPSMRYSTAAAKGYIDADGIDPHEFAPYCEHDGWGSDKAVREPLFNCSKCDTDNEEN